MVKRRSSYLLLSLASGALTSATVLPGCETSCQGICLQPGDPYPPRAGTAASTAVGGGAGGLNSAGGGNGPCGGEPCGLVIRPGNVAGAAEGGSGPSSAGGGGESGNGDSAAGEGGATP